ncbi:alpha/beta hydrolase [Amycolatopsis kentuckyensis]|uniref:alpha/beta hydrolase n=1 Tax=Amycolatopsis kentuckyensis TaxID=218823 RepID=UPI001FC921AD|nr:alpha/beta hydrolase [Amycolatopsis kentuckyensis]
MPLSYREPEGATVTLPVIRLPAGDPGRRLGSLFFDFGGPGTDGVGELTRFAARYPPELRARFDLVSFDPRGIGGSAPISCPGADHLPPIGSPVRQPDACFAASAATGRACAASGALLSHLSTANAARDLDLLRQTVGKPGRERRPVTCGPMSPAQPVDVRADVVGAQQQELDRFSAGDPKRKFAGVFAHASRGPGVASLVKTITSALHQSGRRKRLAQTLAAMPAAPGRVLVVDGYGRTSLDAPSACASAAVVRYLTDLAGPGGGDDLRPGRRSLSLREIRGPDVMPNDPAGTGPKDPAARRARVVSSKGAGPPLGRCGDLGPRRAAHLLHSVMTRIGSPSW